MAIHYFTYETAMGDLTLFSRDGKIIFVNFGERSIASGTREEDETLLLAIKEINQFFFGQRKDFDVPLDPLGDEEEKKILLAAQEVGYGEVSSYEAIAKKTGLPLEKVEKTLLENPCPFFVPCHRIVHADRRIGGYIGGQENKVKLLKLEKANAARLI